MKKEATGKSTGRIPLMFGMMIALVPLTLFAQQPWRMARGFTQQAGDDSIKVRKVSSGTTTLSFEYSLPALKVKSGAAAAAGKTERLELGSAPQRSRPGEPVMPVIPVQIVLPAGMTLDHVALQTGTPVEIPGSHRIEHGQKPIPLLKNASRTVTNPDAKIYDSDDPFPARRVEVVGVQKKRGVAVAIINIFPMSYHPRSGRLIGYTSVKLDVVTKPISAAEGGVHGGRAVQRQLYMSVENPEDLDSYEDGSSNDGGGGVQPLGICDPADSYRYVVITSAALRDATTDVTLRDLISHKQSHGISATIVTVEDIYAEYSGVDNPERIRNFIIDAYSNWETEYVLLGGDVGIIPVRYLYDDGTTIPSDLYYQCLDGTYNNDGDSYWGEPTDGPGGADVDLMAEVAIGRASAENAAEMSNFVYKTIAYANESESSPYLRQAMLLGEYLGSQFGSGIYGHAYAYMKEIHHGSTASGYTTVGFDACAVFNVDSMYDYFGDWPASDLIASFNSDAVSIYNHLGHANETNVMKLTNSSVDALTNTKPFFAYSQGCYPGDYTANCIAEHFTTSNRHGAFAVVFNSRYGWGAHNDGDSTMDGPSQRFDRQFWDAYFGEYILTFGDVNADSHEDNIWDINGNYIRWCMYETNLFGDPQLLIRGQLTGPMVQYLSHTINDAAGNGDGLVNPGEQIVIRPTMVNVGSEIANGVNLQLTTTDGYVSIVDNTADVGDIPCCGSSQEALDDMTVSIASDCPTPHTIQFTLTAHDNATGEWTSEFSITVYTSSQVSGYVRTLTGGNPIAGAAVSFTGPLSGSVTTDASGYYLFGGIDGTYSIVAAADGYLQSSPVSVTIPPTVSNVNFNLARPLMDLMPSSIRETVATGGSTSRSVTLANSGDAPLTFTIAARDYTGTAVQPAERLYDASHFVELPKGAPDTRIGHPVTLGSGGPDQFGYRWTDSDEPGGPVFQWNDISGTGSRLSSVSGCDDCYESRSLSFSFPLYGVEYSTVYVSSNGYCTFGAGSSQYGNYALPSTSMPANLVAGFFDDLYPVNGGDIYFQDFGNRAIVQFNNVVHSSSTYTFQMVIEQNGTITFFYHTLTGTLNSATVGIQNGARDDGLTVVYNASYLKNSLAVRLRPAPAWLAVTPESGTVPAGGSTQLAVQLNSAELTGGTYTGSLEITHNDPTQTSPHLFPCTLYVDGMRRLSVNPSSIDFGSCWVGADDTSQLILTNTGDEVTVVSAITSSNPLFTCSPSLPLSVPAFGSSTVNVVYSPTSLGQHSGALTISSNAEDNPVISITLSGTGTNPPIIAVSPSSFSVAAIAGDSIVRTLSLSNSGGADLSFKIRIQRPAATRVNLNHVQDSIPVISQRETASSDMAVVDLPQLQFENGQLAEQILVLATTSLTNSVVSVLNNLGKPHTLVQTSDFSSIDFNPYDIIIVGMDGGSIYEASVLALANAAASGKKLIMIGGTNLSAYYTGLQNYLLKHTNQQGWTTSTTPHLQVIDPAHPLAYHLPQTYSYVNTSASYYMIRISDSLAHVVSLNGDGFPSLIVKPVGNGMLCYFTSTASDSYWGNSSDRAILQTVIENAIDLSATDWVRVHPDTGIISGGNQINADITFDANGLLGGIYNAQAAIFHNAPSQPMPIVIPCTLTVNGFRSLSASPISLNFDPLCVGLSDTMMITLSNSGNEATLVNSISLNHSAFSALGSLPLTVPPFDSVSVPVVFQPGAVGSHNGTLTVNSDAEDNPVIAVGCTGTGILPPNISVAPASFFVTLNGGDSTDETFIIKNSVAPGNATLTFSIDINGPQLRVFRGIPELIPAPYPIDPAMNAAVGGIDSSARIGPGPLPDKRFNASNLRILYATTMLSTDGTDDFVTGLRALSNVDTVKVLSCTAATPNLAYLQQYDIVVVTSNTSWANASAMGDTLAAYVDAGGKVCILQASFASGGGWVLSGRIMQPDYSPVAATTYTYGSTAISGNFENHPITSGVSSITTNLYSYVTTPQGSGISLGSYTNGYHLAAYNPEKPIVAINVYTNNGYWGGDMLLMMGNTFDYLSGSQWLQLSSTSDTLEPGDSSLITITFNARDLQGGLYLKTLSVTHNATNTASPLEVPCTLTVDGFRSLSASPSSLDFGSLWVGLSDTMVITLSNNGNEATQVNSISSSHPAFSVLGSMPLTVPPLNSVTVPVVYQPGSVESHNGTLTVNSDAEDNPIITVSLAGTGIAAPQIDVSPPAIAVSLNAGDSTVRPLRIKNTGGDMLSFTIGAISGGSVVINEFCSNPDFIELWNRGGDQTMTGWRLSWIDNTSSSDYFDFPSGYVLHEGKRVVLRESSGTDNDSTLYLGSGLGWVTGSIVSVTLLDDQGRGVDFVRTTGSSDAPPSGINWYGTGVSFSSISAYRLRDADTDSTSDWGNSSSHSEYLLNPGQTGGEVLPSWLSVSPMSGNVAAGDSSVLSVVLRASGMAAGIYVDSIRIDHNAPDQITPLVIPVTLQVNDEGEGYISLITGIGISASIKAEGAVFTLRDITIGSPAAGLLRGNQYSLKLR
ncbi:MAG: choice-of-anchor D domain-containing protein [Chitinispirillaceae bacterium]|nr:choice-of-anchor D domain-containing protein [Chitinispirillaceae bacterium]